MAPHWSKYKYPEAIPEGAVYYIIEKGDTLWDLSKRFLGNPYLWPQIWDQNRYVTDAHWIYPGDPLTLPKVSLISERAGEAGEEGAGEEGGLAGEGPVAGAPRGSELQPITEEATMQCAANVVTDREDESLFVIGSELGSDKIALADRDVLYLSKGSNAGVKAGDVYTLHHVSYKVKHPNTGKFLGHKVDTTGWVEIVLVNEDTSTGVISQACQPVHLGDYLKPMERVNVPLVLNRPAATRLTPSSGKLDRVIVDIQDDSMMGGQGSLVTIDAGADSGVAPGNIFTIYRITYPSIPSPRNVLGELAVLAVRDRTALAKVTMSYAEVMVGDSVELR
ncbi:MAG TPA: LysM peptidoglycan-binding domain-containing protein [Vicinamibacteria bacterium]